MTSPKYVGGLDPSLSNFGMVKGIVNYTNAQPVSFTPLFIKLVVTKEDKSIKYKNERDLQRARKLGSAMVEFFHGIDTVYVEMPVGSQSARAMASYGICIGVVAALGKRVIRVSAKDVKLVSTADPNATKRDMIKWATEKYPKLPWLKKVRVGVETFIGANEHVSDALAAVHVGLKIGNQND